MLYWDTHTSSELLTCLPTVITYLQYTKKGREACLYIFSVCRQVKNWCDLLSRVTCSPQVGKSKHNLHTDWRYEYIAIFPGNSLENGTQCKKKDKTMNCNINSIFSEQTLHDGPSPLGCDAMPLGKYCTTFRRMVMAHLQEQAAYEKSLSFLSNLEDECTMIFQNIRNLLPSKTASHSRILEMSTPPLQEPQLSHITWHPKQGIPVTDILSHTKTIKWHYMGASWLWNSEDNISQSHTFTFFVL